MEDYIDKYFSRLYENFLFSWGIFSFDPLAQSALYKQICQKMMTFKSPDNPGAVIFARQKYLTLVKNFYQERG